MAIRTFAWWVPTWHCTFEHELTELSHANRQILRQLLDSDTFLSVPSLQSEIEHAWSRGFDPGGMRQLRGKVRGTRKWIGATECTAVLRSRG